MSADTTAPLRAGSTAQIRRPGLSRFVIGVLRQTLVDPIADGRLRNVSWPYGLPALVAAGYAMFALAGLIVVLSGPIRRQSTLIFREFASVGLPEVAVWFRDSPPGLLKIAHHAVTCPPSGSTTSAFRFNVVGPT